MQKHILSCGYNEPPDEVGCVATNDPGVEILQDFEGAVIDYTVLIIVSSGNEASTKQGMCTTSWRRSTRAISPASWSSD